MPEVSSATDTSNFDVDIESSKANVSSYTNYSMFLIYNSANLSAYLHHMGFQIMDIYFELLSLCRFNWTIMFQ